MDNLPLIVIIALLLTAVVVMWNRLIDLTTHLREAIRRAELAEAHLHETKIALQAALGGGWQLADHTKDVFLLPERDVVEFSDTLTGGVREQFHRRATVRVLMDDALMRRILEADRLSVPLSFRGLEWRLTQISHPRHGGGFLGAQGVEGLYDTTLDLVTYAARQGS